MVDTVQDEDTGKARVVHRPDSKPAAESRQVRRANARKSEKQIARHMNEVVLKKNKKR